MAVALWVPCVCAGPKASGFQGAGPGGADGRWLAAVVAWLLRWWSRLLGSAWVAWPGAGVRVGVFMAWADGDAFPWGGLATGRCADKHKQEGRQSTALTGASLRSCHVTKRFRILATLHRGNKSMYSNTSGYVHMGLRLDWGKGITGQ